MLKIYFKKDKDRIRVCAEFDSEGNKWASACDIDNLDDIKEVNRAIKSVTNYVYLTATINNLSPYFMESQENRNLIKDRLEALEYSRN